MVAQNKLRTFEGNQASFWQKKTILNLKLDSVHTSARCSDLPFNIITMEHTSYFVYNYPGIYIMQNTMMGGGEKKIIAGEK